VGVALGAGRRSIGVLAVEYFWLLDRFDGSILFWIIMILGLLIGLV
jgi:hypothetical protein